MSEKAKESKAEDVPLSATFSKTIFRCYGIGQMVYEPERQYPASRCLGFRMSYQSQLRQLLQQKPCAFPKVDASVFFPNSQEAEDSSSVSDRHPAKLGAAGTPCLRRDICLGSLSLDADMLSVPRCRGTHILILAETEDDEENGDIIARKELSFSSEDIPPLTMPIPRAADCDDFSEEDDTLTIDFSSLLRFQENVDVQKVLMDVQSRARMIAGVLANALIKQVFSKPQHVWVATRERAVLIPERAVALAIRASGFCKTLVPWKPSSG